MLTHVVLGLAVVAAYAVLAAVSPTRRCGRCGGKRVTRTRWRQRVVGCPRCHGTGRCYRFGAVAVHRFIQAARSERRDDGKER